MNDKNFFQKIVFCPHKIKTIAIKKAPKTSTTTTTTTPNNNNKMFLKNGILLLSIASIPAQGYQLRRRNLLADTCIPVALDSSSAFVVVDIEGENSNNITDVQLKELASTFELSYNGLVTCDVLPGSIRDLQQTTVLAGAVGPAGSSSYLLKLDFFCNACGDSEVKVFSTTDSPQEDQPASKIAETECACEGPDTDTFVTLHRNLFEESTSSLLQVATVGQIPVLDCPSQDKTTFNSTGVCLGPDLQVKGFAGLSTESPSGTCNARSKPM